MKFNDIVGVVIFCWFGEFDNDVVEYDGDDGAVDVGNDRCDGFVYCGCNFVNERRCAGDSRAVVVVNDDVFVSGSLLRPFIIKFLKL